MYDLSEYFHKAVIYYLVTTCKGQEQLDHYGQAVLGLCLVSFGLDAKSDCALMVTALDCMKKWCILWYNRSGVAWPGVCDRTCHESFLVPDLTQCIFSWTMQPMGWVNGPDFFLNTWNHLWCGIVHICCVTYVLLMRTFLCCRKVAEGFHWIWLYCASGEWCDTWQACASYEGNVNAWSPALQLLCLLYSVSWNHWCRLWCRWENSAHYWPTTPL